jgi:hypothetical protein
LSPKKGDQEASPHFDALSVEFDKADLKKDDQKEQEEEVPRSKGCQQCI